MSYSPAVGSRSRFMTVRTDQYGSSGWGVCSIGHCSSRSSPRPPSQSTLVHSSGGRNPHGPGGWIKRPLPWTSTKCSVVLRFSSPPASLSPRARATRQQPALIWWRSEFMSGVFISMFTGVRAATTPICYRRLKIAYVITLLTGRACEWGTSVWDAEALFCNDFEDFSLWNDKAFWPLCKRGWSCIQTSTAPSRRSFRDWICHPI